MATMQLIIGVDPHKRSHTAVILDDTEEIDAQVRVDADRRQVPTLLAWAPEVQRVWAVENANGPGRLLAQQLVGAGEVVIDVPASLSARARLLSGKSATKTDAHDARSVVIAARHQPRLRRVVADDDIVELGLVLQRRAQLVSERQRVICYFHVLAADLVPAGANRQLSWTQAHELIGSIRSTTPIERTRKQLARDLLEQWRWLNRRITPHARRLDQLLARQRSTLTDIYGISTIGAATILSIVGDVSRFPTVAHFAAGCGTAPVQASSGDIIKHRLSRRGNRQLNKVLHTAAVTQLRINGQARTYYQKRLDAGDTRLGALRKLKRQLAGVTYRTIKRDQSVRCGQTETRP